MLSLSTLVKKAAQKFIPLSCLFEVTHRCNLRCIHCYIVKDKRPELKKYEVFNVINQLKKAGCLFLTFSGGEPLIRSDFFDIANYAKKNNFALRIFTNGTLITSETAKEIKKLKVIAVEISVYGFESTHDKITGKSGAFSRAISAIELLKKNKVPVVVKSVLMRQNVHEYWDLRKFLENELKIKVKGASLLISPRDNGDKAPIRNRLTDEQLKKYIKAEFEILGKIEKKIFPRTHTPFSHLCLAGLNMVNVTPYGEVNPCVQIRIKNNNKISDKHPFSNIWKNNPEFKKLRNLYMKDKKDCWGCDLLPFCVTCPGIALLEEGSLTAKLSEACRQARIRKEVYEEIVARNE